MDRERLDSLCEKGILGLVLAMLAFGVLATGAVRTFEFLVVQAMALGVMLLWLVRFWVNRSHRLLWPPICWAVLAFVLYAVVRYLTADIEYVAREELIRVLVYAVVFFAVLNNLHRQETAQLAVYVLIFLAMVVSIYAVYQFITTSEYVWHFKRPLQYIKRGSGTYICPNHFAGFAEMILPLGVALTLSGRLKTMLKVFLGYASIMILAGLGASISRAGWVCAASSLLLLLVLLVKRHPFYRIPALIALATLLGGGVFFYYKSAEAQRRIAKMAPSEDNVISESGIRLLIWKSAVQMWKEHPWVGVGPAHFDYRFPAYRSPYVQARPGRVHNDYLNTLADWGVVGFSLIMTALGLFTAGVLRCWKYVQHSSNTLSSKPSNRSALVLGGAIGIAAIALHSLADFNLHIPANAMVAVTLIALTSSYLRFASERYWISVRPLLRLLVTLVLLAGLGYLGAQEVRRFREFRLLQQVQEIQTDADRLALLDRAYAVEPNNPDTSYLAGEVLRLQSWRLDPGYETLADQAAQWFQRAITANPFDTRSMLRLGMCLHWNNRHAEAAPWFDKARALDPEGYFTLAHVGWHHIQIGQWAEARQAFERSLWIKPHDNKIAVTYLKFLNEQHPEERSQ